MTTGAFIATSFPTWTVLIVLVAAVAIDAGSTLLIMRDPATLQYEPTRMSLTTRRWAIGLGDLLSYSILTTHAYVLAGAYLAGVTIILVLASAAITLRVMTNRSMTRIAGLPLTLAPSIALVSMVWVLSLL